MLDKYASDILLKLEREGDGSFGGLARVVHNPKTLSRKLAMLRSIGFVNKAGGNYSLTKKGKRAAGIVEQWRLLEEPADYSVKNIGRVPHPTFGPVLERYCGILREHFGSGLLGVVLFGSVARGDWTEDSDIDLLVVVEGWGGRSWDRSKELLTLRNELRRTEEYQDSIESGYVPTIQHYPLSAEEASQRHRIYPDLVLDGIVIYEKDGAMTQLLRKLRDRLDDMGARRITTASGEYHWEMRPIPTEEGNA